MRIYAYMLKMVRDSANVYCSTEEKLELKILGYSYAEVFRIGADVVRGVASEDEIKLIAKRKETEKEIKVLEIKLKVIDNKLKSFEESREEKEQAEKEAQFIKDNSCSKCKRELNKDEKAKAYQDRKSGGKLCKSCYMIQ